MRKHKIYLIIPLLYLVTLFSCKDLQGGSKSLENINKFMLFFNYDTNELCLLDIDTGLIETNYKINFYVQKYVVDKFDYTSRWYYSYADKNLYLLRNHIDWNDSSNIDTRIYKIDIETFELSEIYYSNKNKFYSLCVSVTDDYLYLLSYVEPSSNGKSNKEKNYIVKYNFQNNSEEAVYFNKLLPEDKQVYAPYFHVLDDEIILYGWSGEGYRIERNLYKYDMSTEMMYVLDENVFSFSIFNDKIMYRKKDIEADNTNFMFYDLKNNIKINLQDKINSVHLDDLLVDENIMIFSREHKTIRTIIDKFWIFPSNKILKDYYIADISGNAQKKFFKSRDQIDIFGIINKKTSKQPGRTSSKPRSPSPRSPSGY